MKIRKNKYYINGYKELIGPLIDNIDPIYKFGYEGSTLYTFTTEGRYLNELEDGWDLIHEATKLHMLLYSERIRA